MADSSLASDAALRARVGVLLAAPLRARAAEADVVARTLAPDGPGPGVRFHVYEESLVSARRHEAYQKRFAAMGDLLDLLEVGDPGAIELAFEILARLDPDAVTRPAAALLAGRDASVRWTALGAALGHALGRGDSEESFRLLVDRPDLPHLREGLATHGFPGGVDEAWRRVEAARLDAAELEPTSRVETLPFVSYLLRHDRARAFTFVVRLLEAPQIVAFATHALAAISPQGHDVLLARLAATPPGVPLDLARRAAVRLLLEDDARTAIDRLGGMALLSTDAGDARLDALLYCLARDTWDAKDRGGAHGWLRADPRFRDLLAPLVGRADRRERAATARDLLATLPGAPARAPRTSRMSQPTPSAALVREMQAFRDRLARLVAYLARTKYRFVDRRGALLAPRAKDLAAVTRLEKRVIVPAALACFWRTVGSVDLRGTAPGWPRTAYLGFDGAREPTWQSDPLVVATADVVVRETLEAHADAPYALHLAPDALGKAGYSAGMLTMWLPASESDDAALEGASETFLAHLRRSFASSGFPGLATEPLAAAWLTEAARAME